MKKKILSIVMAVIMTVGMIPAMALTAFANTGAFDGEWVSITTYTVTVDSAITHGTVTSSVASTSAGSTVTLTATPDEGYSLAADTLKVSDGTNEIEITAGENNTFTFTMPAADVTVTARFGIPIGEVYYVNDDENGVTTFFGIGTLSSASSLANILQSNVVIEEGITAIGNNAFRGLSSLATLTVKGDLTAIGRNAFQGCSSLEAIYYYGTTSPSSVGNDLSGVKLYSANGVSVFGLQPENAYTVSINATENGTVTVPQTMAAAGDTVKLTVKAAEGYELDTLTVSDGTGSIPTTKGHAILYTFPMPAANVTVTTTFKATSPTISIIPPINGSVAAPASMAAGSTVTFMVTPNTNYEIDTVTVSDGTNTIPTAPGQVQGAYTFTMPASDVTITATFKAKATAAVTITDITIRSYNNNGSVTVDSENQVYTITIPAGATKTPVTVNVIGQNLDKIPAGSDTYWAWYLPAVSSPLSSSGYVAATGNIKWDVYVVTGDVGVGSLQYSTDSGTTWTETGWTVVVQQEPAGTVTVNTAENGTVTSDKDTAAEGDTVTLTVTPTEGYELDTLAATDANGDPVDINHNTFTMPASNVTVTATFKKIVYATKTELEQAVQSLQDQIDALEEEIATNGGTTTGANLQSQIDILAAALVTVNQKLANLDTTYVTHTELDTALMTVNEAVTKLNTEIIPTIEGNISANTAAITSLNTTVTDLSATVAGLPTTAVTDQLRTDLDTLSGSLSDLTDRVSINEAAIGDLKTAIAGLEALVDNNTVTIGELEQALADIHLALGALDDTYVTHDELTDELVDALVAVNAAIDKLNNEIIPAIQGDVADNAGDIADLNNTVGNLATIVDNIQIKLSELSLEDTRLEGLISTLEASLSALSGSLDTLKGRVDTAEKDIATLKEDLLKAIEDLKKLIADGDQANADALAEAIVDLKALIETAEQAAKDGDEDVKRELYGYAGGVYVTLDAAVKELSKQLDEARSALDRAIADGNGELDAKITALRETLEAADAALEAANTALKADLTLKIEQADETLKSAMDALSDELARVKKELEKADAGNKAALEAKDASLAAKDAELEAKDDELKLFVIILCVIACTTLVGVTAFVI
ncbi:MAG: leucine-rich repeat protein, partial [Clostridia bacterium]|nr:leucine-rich repeat protein [Clostridia bacterium]